MAKKSNEVMLVAMPKIQFFIFVLIADRSGTKVIVLLMAIIIIIDIIRERENFAKVIINEGTLVADGLKDGFLVFKWFF